MNRGMPCEERRERDEWRRKRKRCVWLLLLWMTNKI
jgi:hypothetical protein